MDWLALDLLPPLLKGLKITLLLTLYSIILALCFSFLAGIGRLSHSRILRSIVAAYVEIFRGTSLLVQLFWIYFALPMLLDIRLSAMTAAVLALGLNYGAYGSEVVRSSILAVPKGQVEASIALNMTPYQRMRRIILPQAWAMMLPGFGNLQIELLKGTSLVYLITLMDVTYQGITLRSFDISRTPAIFAWILILYFVTAYALTLLIRFAERKAAAGRG
ncbi:ectoine/hydroxyectoine ABC transporter permease subunit EhuC [Paenibacillus mendelii]|uniref:Ectoine/hydroxyectoine ABC transporter permease subunit EhuC n=1 Tax=Paenibacillus mendelii TaxID=206163 RepID=A0ABV6J1Y7_9BACL|nr:ectoine/hydroxyectoine ABC transporter permease subunit EhuC [Paenibacillus mendelii]MCQ6562823.1 ectoine/hydroxyectoine ABC transporter permease subunit EhuC [Paenibacillus mendelii]